MGIVAVPDERLNRLSRLSDSQKTIPAAVEFVDIAGLVKGAAEGEGLGNQFLSHIREVDAIAEVVRVFKDPNIIHVHGEVRPMSDIEVINLELSMADLQTVTKRLSTIEKEVKRGDKDAAAESVLLQKVAQGLEQGKLARAFIQTDAEKKILKGLHLLTAKPILYILNTKSVSEPIDEEHRQELDTFLRESGALWVEIDAGVEQELSDVSADEKQQFRREFGVLDDGVDTLIRKGYELLDLITFFTTGPDETRGWTIKRGSTAPEAGAAIHTDFRDTFIRAEVTASDKLLDAGSYAAAREKGWVRTEGKEYVVQDGDVIEFKI